MSEEIEALVIGNILNDPSKLKLIAVLPEYFYDPSFRAVIEYVTDRETWNLYDMCKDLDMNFEIATELATCISDEATYLHRVNLLLNQAELRDYLRTEIENAFFALKDVDPLFVGEVMLKNLETIIGQRDVPQVSE